jgi:glycerol uptake facilitator-like aquaporin
MKKLIGSQLLVLFVGAAFAWFTFSRELDLWLDGGKCVEGCGANIPNPFLTPCFFGAVFFTVALILSVLIFVKNRK